MRRALLLFLLVLLAVSVAEARTRRTLKVKFPPLALAPGSNTETCYFVRIPTTESFPLGSFTVAHKGARGGTQPVHFLAYLYTGEHLADFPTGAVSSRGCLDLGPVDRDRRVLFATGAARRVERFMPSGVALDLAPVSDAPGGAPAAIGVLLDANWANDEPRTRTVSTKLVLRRVPEARIRRHARPLQDRSAEAGILVPPYTLRSTADLVDARWPATTDVCLLGLSGQMHRRGRCLGVDRLDATGAVVAPASGIANPCEADRRQQLFVGLDFTDPGSLPFTLPMAMGAGEALRYACWLDNGASRAPVRLGCMEEDGVTPGSPQGGPARECSLAVPASSECPGNAACVPANAVAGPDVDDEVCGLTAFVYDAAPGGGCDVSGLP